MKPSPRFQPQTWPGAAVLVSCPGTAGATARCLHQALQVQCGFERGSAHTTGSWRDQRARHPPCMGHVTATDGALPSWGSSRAMLRRSLLTCRNRRCRTIRQNQTRNKLGREKKKAWLKRWQKEKAAKRTTAAAQMHEPSAASPGAPRSQTARAAPHRTEPWPWHINEAICNCLAGASCQEAYLLNREIIHLV